MLFYLFITIQKLINLLLKQKNLLKMDDFSRAIALLFYQKLDPLRQRFFVNKMSFPPTLNAILPLYNHTEANKFASRTKKSSKNG